ncbi:MAG: polysaccharide pyruvyl transferase family protein [Desulfuromonadaceae bacterium]|nr:polysaccharide pyruvyl transferase family protein [Desulfuromonadaceae bacterium]
MVKQAVIINDTSWENHHGCRRVMENLYLGLNNAGISVLSAYPVGRDWRKNIAFCEDICRSDLVIVNGEGTVHHDLPMAWSLVSAGAFAAKHSVPSVLLNATWYANSSELAVSARSFNRIYVRESRSQAELACNGVKSTVVPDLTFMSPCDGDATVQRSGLAVTDSVYADLSEQLYRFTLDNKQVEFLPLLAPYRIREWSVKAVRKAVSYKLYGLFGQLLEPFGGVRQHYISMRYVRCSVSDFIQAVSHCKLLVNARFHGLCFALQTKTPFLALSSNSHKVEALLEDVGVGLDRFVSEATISLEDCRERAETGFSLKEVDAIEKYNLEAKSKIANMFSEIASI